MLPIFVVLLVLLFPAAALLLRPNYGHFALRCKRFFFVVVAVSTF